MRVNWPMIKRLARRIGAGRGRDIRSLAVKEWTLCPEKVAPVPKALYLDGAIEKIVAVSPWRKWAAEMAYLKNAHVTHGPTRAYVIENVDIVNPCLYAGPAKDKPGYGPEQWLLDRPYERLSIDKANLVTTVSGSHFFGTLLLDDFPLELIGERSENISMVAKPFEHERGYREALGLADTPLVRYARVKQLTFYDEAAFNVQKATRYRELRARLRCAFTSTTRAAKPGVYLRRGRTGELRLLTNETEIEAFLASIGFDIVEPSSLPVEEIVRRTLDSKVVVSVEGSHLSHTIYSMADDGAFLVLQPPDRFALNYKELTDCLDMRYAFLVGDPSSSGFTVPLGDLQRILDRLL